MGGRVLPNPAFRDQLAQLGESLGQKPRAVIVFRRSRNASRSASPSCGASCGSRASTRAIPGLGVGAGRSRRAVTADPRPRASWRLDGLAAGVVLFAVIALAAALYLSDPIQRRLVVPSGADTSAHLWRAELVAATDLRALFDASAQDFQVNPDRVGLPVLASLLSGLGVTPWHLMFIVPALAAALLAAAGWGSRAAEEPRWAAPVYALALAGSVPFALTTKSYLDNALVDGVIVASAAGLLLIASDRAAWP